VSERDKLGSSGVFKAIVMSARKFKRAVTGGEDELPPEVEEIGNAVARAFIAGRFGDVYLMTSPLVQRRLERGAFETQWSEVVRGRGALTGFDVTNVGQIDLGFIPGLEETPQSEFRAFLEVSFSSPEIPLDHEKAFVVGVVILDQGQGLRIGALHTR
jgi:hypothetical protein